jgi:hypothetical protein
LVTSEVTAHADPAIAATITATPSRRIIVILLWIL